MIITLHIQTTQSGIALKRATSADLIEEYFHQICGIDGVICSYLMQEKVLSETSIFDEKEPVINLQMIKEYPIVS